MAIRVLIESLLGGPTVSTATSGNISGGDRKDGGAREWIKNKLKALSQLLDKLADNNGSPTRNHRFHTFMDSEQSKRSGWLVISELWALMTGVGVLTYIYFMTKTRRK